MANFFDQKQEVIDIELTKHGRKLLGLGIFQPEYYEFFDDTVLYDQGYAGIVEDQNSIKDRILDESLTLRALNLSKDLLKNPLGDSKTTSDYAPTWDLQVLNGAIIFVPESSSYGEKVFDTKDISYIISLENQNVTQVPNYNFSNFELEDGRIITIKDDYILIDLKEINMEDDNQNFEIEIVTYDELSGGKEADLSRKLVFTSKQTNIIDGIIYSNEELPIKYNEINLDENDAQYYLDILVDEEIDREIITAAAKVVKEQIKPTYKTTFEGSVKEDC